MKARLLLLISAFVMCISTSRAIDQDADGVYQIATAQDLVDFAALVNGGTTSANAKVTADIDASSVSYTPIGNYTSNQYIGTFDGGEHEIKLNLKTTGDGKGLFGYIGAATIKNVSVTGSITITTSLYSNGINVGGIVGNIVASGAIITNCHNSANVTGSSDRPTHYGGIVGYIEKNVSATITGCTNKGTIIAFFYVGGIVGYWGNNWGTSQTITISNCVNYGTIKSNTSSTTNSIGGIFGDAMAGTGTIKITACANHGSVQESGGAIIGCIESGSCSMTSCYNEVSGLQLCRKGTSTSTLCYNIGSTSSSTTFTEEELASGALCYNLNGGSDGDIYWRQTIDTDATPVLSTDSKIVYTFKNCMDGTGYSNTKGLPDGSHYYSDGGICKYNEDHYIKEGDLTVKDGVYQIANVNDLMNFAKIVNDDHFTNAKGLVIADIDASSVSYTPIGSASNYHYTGEFDGGGKTITLNINNTSSYNQGLFGHIGAATIKNVNVAGTITGKGTIGGIAGYVVADGATIENCSNSAAVTAAGYRYAAGIVGFARYDCTISNCTNKGTITGASQRNGGIVGSIDYAGVTISGCVNEGEVISSETHAGGIVGFIYTSSTCKITSCINRAAVSGEGYVGGIVGCIHSSSPSITVEKCINESNGAISATGSKYPAGGIIGGPFTSLTESNVVKVIACANHGSVSNSSSFLGGIFGWINNSYEITSCYNDKSGLNLHGGKGSNGTKTFTRCYNITSCSDATTFTSDELTNGALCYNLNGSSTDVYWYQTIGTDASPVLSSESKIVYCYYNCNQTAVVAYSNTNDASLGGTHNFGETGLCADCEKVYAEQDNITVEDGVYQISKASELMAFAKAVNDYHCTKAKGLVTADIDASGVSYTPIGSAEAYYYAGEFDGGEHTITLSLGNSSSDSQGLFGVIGAAKISNVKVAGTVTGKNNVGGIVGYVRANGGTITNCHNYATVTATGEQIGGIVGYAYQYGCTISECTNNAAVSSSAAFVGGILGRVDYGAVTIEKCINNGDISTSSGNIAGIVGWANSRSNKDSSRKTIITACANRGKILSGSNAGAIVGYFDYNFYMTSCYNEDNSNSSLMMYALNSGNGTKSFTNCYNINTVTELNSAIGTFTSDDLTSGALCYNLNGGVKDLYWYQTIYSDAHPVLTAADDEANVVNKLTLTQWEEGFSYDLIPTYFNTGFSVSGVLEEDAKSFYVFDFDATDKARSIYVPCVKGIKNALVNGEDGTYTCDNAVLLDGVNYALPYDYTAKKFTYERTLKTADKGINTFILPVEASTDDINGTVYKLNGYEDGVLKFEEMTGTLEANTPYLVQCTADADGNAPTLLASTLENVTVKAMTAGSVTAGEATHIGTYVAKNSTDNASDFSGKTLYGYMDGAFVKATGTWTLNPFRTLITVPTESAVKALAIDLGGGGAATAVGGYALGSAAPVDVYTLSGIKLRTATPRSEALRDLPAGVYIVGGEKVIKK